MGWGGQAGMLSQPECDDRLAGLDRSCGSDPDCAVATFNRCGGNARSDVLGIAQTELERFAEIAAACRAPASGSQCSHEAGGLGAPVTEDGLTLYAGSQLTAAARCVNERCESYATTCGRELCGNGEIQDCGVIPGPQPTFTPNAPLETATSEECDGETFNFVTCRSRGYAGGVERCVEDSCVVDLSGCTVCPEPGTGPECRTDDEGPVDWLVSAGSDQEVALLYLRSGVLHFARYAVDDLSVLSSVEVPRAEASAGMPGAIARGPDGWVVAVELRPGTYSLLAADDGTDELVERSTRNDALPSPFLLPRDGKTPLLGTATNGAACELTLLDDDLVPETIIKDLSRGCQGGAAVEGGFVIGYTENLRAGVGWVAPDLGPIAWGDTFALATPSGSDRVLVERDGDGAILLHDIWSEGAAWLYRLGSDGLLLQDPVNPFVGRANVTRPGHFVSAGGLVYLPVEAVSEGIGYQGVRLYTVDSMGTVIADSLIATPASHPDAVLGGQEVFVTFLTSTGFGLARFVP